MSIHIGEMTSEMTVVGGDLPLSRDQIEKLVSHVIKRLDQRDRDARRSRESTSLQRGVSRTGPIGE